MEWNKKTRRRYALRHPLRLAHATGAGFDLERFFHKRGKKLLNEPFPRGHRYYSKRLRPWIWLSWSFYRSCRAVGLSDVFARRAQERIRAESAEKKGELQ